MRKYAIFLYAVAFFITGGFSAFAGSTTLTTYYPAPDGNYNKLTATNVGIGEATGADALDVAGNMTITNNGAATGNITATGASSSISTTGATSSISSANTLSAVNNITSTTGNITATAGNISATGASSTISTTGATSSISSANTLSAVNNITSTAGNISATGASSTISTTGATSSISSANTLNCTGNLTAGSGVGNTHTLNGNTIINGSGAGAVDLYVNSRIQSGAGGDGGMWFDGLSQHEFVGQLDANNFGFWSNGNWALVVDQNRNVFVNAGNLTVQAGNISCTGAACTITASSDARLKENIVPIMDPLGKIQRLNGVAFTWKGKGTRDIGVTAQNVEKVFPEIVHTFNNGNKGVEYGNLVAVLIEGIKEQQKEIKDLQKKVEELQKQK